MKRTTFPTRRHGAVRRGLTKAWEFYEQCSLKVLGVVLVIAGIVMLCGRELFGAA